MVDHMDFDNADQVRTCTRKKGYPSGDVARLAIASIRQANPDADLRSYGCRHCGLWHVGGVPASERRPSRFEDEDAESRLESARRRLGRGKRNRRGVGSGYIRRPSRRRDEEDGE